MHWEVIDKNRYNILKKVVETISLTEQFEKEPEKNIITIEKFFEDKKSIEISSKKLELFLNGVQLTFLCFKNNLVVDKIAVEDIKGLYLASIEDIAIMKLIAISQRGTKKDFFDLYYICNNFNITITDILNMLDKKYDENKINYAHIIQSLAYFEDAEDENLPKAFIDYDWQKIKEYYIKEQKKIYSENCAFCA